MKASFDTPDGGAKPREISATETVDWQDFRDHLATADKEGKRRWVYAKKPHGHWYGWRTRVSWFLIACMFSGPFVRINGNPLLMINIVERRASILGQIFWPQDAVIFAVAMLLFLTGIIVFTTAFGRLWCGWTCPQTVMMEMVFRKIEYWIEGDAHEQRTLDAAPWTPRKVAKKAAKHAIFFGLSWIIGNTLLSYIIGSDQLFSILKDNPRFHVTGLFFMTLFTFLFYVIFARFREQACTFICPYGRLQSTMMDENTMVVAYDFKRGEQRGPLRRDQTYQQRRAARFGDCVQCRQCVAVCPTGIDIRDGIQMDCVNCTACIDACDTVMDKVGSPRGLIRFASLNSIQKGEPFRFTARMKLYLGVLSALIALFLYLVLTRSDIETAFLRAPGSLFQTTASGRVQNLYTVKIVNKTTHDIPAALKLEGVPGDLRIMGGALIIPAAQVVQSSVLVEIDSGALNEAKTPLTVAVYAKDRGKVLQRINTVFLGPRRIEGAKDATLKDK